MGGMYPAFLRLNGRRVVLVGGGKVAAGKLQGLLAEGAQVTVVAPEIRPELEQPGVMIERRGFEDRGPRRGVVRRRGGAARGQPAGARRQPNGGICS